MFKKKFPSLSSLGSDGNTAFLRAARAGHLDKVLEHLKANIDINTSNTNGLNALHLASKDGHVGVVTELLKRGAVVDSATKKGNTALHIASLAGQEDVVKLLVASGAAVNVQSQNGFTPLYMAAQENHDNVVRFLLANGANQSLATEDGFTPLAVAMQQGHDKVVAVLLENDTRGKVRLPALHIAAKKDDCKAAALLLQNEHNPDVTSKSGFTPLHIAAHYGNEGIANLLLNKGADVNYSAKHNISPLHVAAKWGKTNLVSLLLEKGATIESKTRDGLTPLHCAARSGHEQVVDMMLERGAPISSKTKNGLAPLHMAAQGDHVDAARILLYHKAPVDDVTVDYLTALHVAAHCGHVRVAKLLLDRKADPNSRALNGFTPLHIACKKNRIKVVELLLKHGGSIEATTESGLTPLHVASFMGCMNIVIFLLQNDASPDIPTVRGETPLHLAARANQTDIIRILLRNGAQVDARAREQQTPLHIASRLGNVDIVMLLLQHGAAVDSTTKDMYTALHIAAKEGQEEVASVLLEHGASLTATTKKGFTPLHLASKYGNIKVAKLLLQKEAPVDAQGKNGVTPLHVASHYDHQNVALLLLDKGASPHATAKNGHTPLHIAARKNQMDIATTLLEYGAKANAESKAGFTPLHLSAQEGHTDMSTLLIEHGADTNHKAKNGLTPLHLCAQEDRVNVSAILVKNGAQVDSTTKAGYTPLHVASHFGQVNMIRFLLMNGADVGAATSVGYTPLHQAAQQGHTTVVNLLLEKQAPPNQQTNQGQTPLCIAQKLGYISVVETLKGVTEPTVVNGNGPALSADEKYRVVAPETMQETFMSDSEDEGGEDTMLSDQPYRYLTVDEMKSLGDDSLPIDVTRDERMDSNRECMAPPQAVDDTISPQHVKESYSQFAAAAQHYTADNIDISRHPVNVGFLVSFLVDARGGAMRGCRHSGVRVIVPPRKAAQPMRVTCRYLKRDKLAYPPPLMEGEALASRILELGPVGGKFLGPVVIEVPHFGSLRGMEREIVILRSDNGETWREHTLEASDEAVHDVMSESFEADEVNNALEDPSAGRTTRILTSDFPQYFAVVSRIRQEVHAIGPEGGMVSSSVVPQVQAVFPQGALTKKIKVGLQAQPIPAELAAKLLGNRVAVSPIVTVEPRRRKFHKPITLTIPVPRAANKGMINQYSGEAPTLRLLCSITGGTTRAQWEDVTGSTPFTFVNDCVSFTTTVSARFWLMDCRNIADATKMATELYREAIHVPFMAKFVVFAKRTDVLEARLRVFCMTDDKEDKTLEHQEHFTEVAKSRDVEVLEGKPQYVEFSGNLCPVAKSGDQLQLGFRAFRENRLPFTVRVKDPHAADPVGRVVFMREGRVGKGEPPQQPICVLNIVLPEDIVPEATLHEADLLALNKKYSFLRDGGLGRLESYQRTNLRLSDISNLIGQDWVPLAHELDIDTSDVNNIKSDFPDSVPQQAMSMLRLWLQQAGNKANGNTLETALRKVGRDDIVQQCIFNVEQTVERPTSRVHTLAQQLGREMVGGVRRNISLDAAYDEQDIMKESESVEELVQAERVVPPGERRQYSDEGESKYVGEEKVVVEEQRSVSALKEIFAQDKRDRQYERQPSAGSVTSEEQERVVTSRPASMVEKVTRRVVTSASDQRPRSEVVETTTTVRATSRERDDEDGYSSSSVEEIRQRFSGQQVGGTTVTTTVTKVTKKAASGIPVTPEMAKKAAAHSKEEATAKVEEVASKKALAEVSPVVSKKASGIPKATGKAVVAETEAAAKKGAEFVSQSTSEVTVTTKTSGIPVVTKTTKVVETVKQVVDDGTGTAEMRRDSALFQGVSEELGRLETTFRVEPVTDGVLSPKLSKTPPPSPAEFNREQNGSSGAAWSSTGATVAARSTELQPTAQEWSDQSGGRDHALQPGDSPSLDQDASSCTVTKVRPDDAVDAAAAAANAGVVDIVKKQTEKPVKHVQFSPTDQIMTTQQFLRQESEHYDFDTGAYAIPQALKVAGLVAGTVSVPRDFTGEQEQEEACVKRGICEALEVAGKVAGTVSVPREIPGEEVPPGHGLSEALEVAGKVAGTVSVPLDIPEEEPARRGRITEALEVAGKVAGTVPIRGELPGEDGKHNIYEALGTAGDVLGAIPTHRRLSTSESKMDGQNKHGDVDHDPMKGHHIFEALETVGDVLGAVPTHRRLSVSEVKVEDEKKVSKVEGEKKHHEGHHIFEALESAGDIVGLIPTHRRLSTTEVKVDEGKHHHGLLEEGLEMLGKLASHVPLLGDLTGEEPPHGEEEECRTHAGHLQKAIEHEKDSRKKVTEELHHFLDTLGKVSEEMKHVTIPRDDKVAEEMHELVDTLNKVTGEMKHVGVKTSSHGVVKDLTDPHVLEDMFPTVHLHPHEEKDLTDPHVIEEIFPTVHLHPHEEKDLTDPHVIEEIFPTVHLHPHEVKDEADDEVQDLVDDELPTAKDKMTRAESLQRDVSMEALSKSVADIPKKLAEEIAHAAEQELEIAERIAGITPLRRGLSKESMKGKGAEVAKEVAHVVEEELEIAGKIAGAVPLHRDISREEIKIPGKEHTKSVSEEVTHVVEKELDIAGKIAGAVPLHRDISREEIKIPSKEHAKSVLEEVTHVVEKELDIAGKIAGAVALTGATMTDTDSFNGKEFRKCVTEEVTRKTTQELDSAGNASGAIPLHRDGHVEDLTALGREAPDSTPETTTRYREEELIIPSDIPGEEPTHKYTLTEERTVRHISPTGFSEEVKHVLEKELEYVGNSGDKARADLEKPSQRKEEEHGIGEALELAGMIAGVIPTRREILHTGEDVVKEVVGSMKISPLNTEAGPGFDIQHSSTVIEVTRSGGDDTSYVTTPTLPRRELGVGGSQRLVGDRRPAPLDVTNQERADGGESDEEAYVVTEPVDVGRGEVGGGEGAVRGRRPLFHIESEEDDLTDVVADFATRDYRPGDVKLTEVDEDYFDEQVKGDEFTRRLVEGVKVTDVDEDDDLEGQVVKGFMKVGPMGELMKGVERVKETVTEKMVDGGKVVEKTVQVVRTMRSDGNDMGGGGMEDSFSDEFERALGGAEDRYSDEEGNEEDDDDDKLEKKLRRVERRFERMASETLCRDVDDATITAPEADQRREAEFQRMLSQLSTDEVIESQKDFTQLWEEGGGLSSMTPSEEWDSASKTEHDTPSNPEVDDDSPQAVCGGLVPATAQLKVSYSLSNIPSIVIDDCDVASEVTSDPGPDPLSDLADLSDVTDGGPLSYVSDDFDVLSLYTSDEDDDEGGDEERPPVVYLDFTNPKYDQKPQATRQESSAAEETPQQESLTAEETPQQESVNAEETPSQERFVRLDRDNAKDLSRAVSEGTLAVRSRGKSPTTSHAGPHTRWSVCSLEESPLGDQRSEWGPREAQSTTTTTTTTITRGAEGLIPQGAAGGTSVTTTETRVVEGSADMQDLLDKLAAESRK